MSIFSARFLSRPVATHLRSSFTRKFLLGGSLLTASVCLSQSSPISLDDKIKELNDTVQVDKEVDPLPTRVNFTTQYDLLGVGSRAVTFLKFKVYALGIYAATEDLDKISTVLDSKFLSTAFIDTDSSKPHNENVSNALHDASKAKILIENLLDSNIRLIARITPVRNTDFNHLRDGLTKSILSAKFKDETLDQALKELKDAFDRKGSAPKNSNLILERLGDGQLQVYFENSKTGEFVTMGTVKTPILSKVLFLQYLTGALSPSVRDSCVEKICQLV